MKRISLLMAWLVVSLASASTRVQASPLTSAPPSWGYSFSVMPHAITSSNVAINFLGSEGETLGNSQVTLGQIQIRETDGATIIPTGSTWTGDLTLSDASGVSKPLTVQSTLSGTLSPLWNIATTPLQPVSAILPAGWSSMTDANGQKEYVWQSPSGNRYSVTPQNAVFVGNLPSATYGGGPSMTTTGQNGFTLNPNAEGSISAELQVSTTGTPEPSSLLLAFLGLGCAGLASWRQRRRKQETQLG